MRDDYQSKTTGDLFSSYDREEENNVSEEGWNLLNVQVFKPEKFYEMKEIANSIIEGNSAILNFELLDDRLCTRFLDFLSGVVYAFEGNTKKISNNVILFFHKNVNLSGELFEADGE